MSLSWIWLWFLIVINAENIDELSSVNIVFTNHTGLPIARIEIGDRRLDGSVGIAGAMGVISDKVLIAVSPEIHDMKVTFRGGAILEFHHLNFKEIHEVIFERKQNHISIRTE